MNPRGTYADHTWAELERRLLELHDERLTADGPARHRDDGGVAQRAGGAIDPGSARRRWRWRARRTTRSRSRSQASRPVSGAGRAADAGPGSRDRGAGALRHASSASRACWSTASRRSAIPTTRSTTTCRSTGRSGPRSERLGRAVLSASAQSRCRATRVSTPAIRGCMGAAWAFGNETAVHALRLIGLRPVRRAPAASRSCSATWARTSRSACGGSTTATLGAGKTDGHAAKNKIADYFRANFYVTTSGNFSTPALIAYHR